MAEKKEGVEATVRTIRPISRKKYLAEEQVRIVLQKLRGETSIAALCRREGIPIQPLLSVEQGVPRGGEATPGRQHRAAGGQPASE